MESQTTCIFNVRVFNPLAPSLRNTSLPSCYRQKEQEKRRAYDQQIRDIEHGSFTPLIFSTSEGLGPAAIVAYKGLAALLSEKQGKQYGLVMNWMRCKLSFSLLGSSITCLRGYRSPHQASGTSTNSIELESIVYRIPQCLFITNYINLFFSLSWTIVFLVSIWALCFVIFPYRHLIVIRWFYHDDTKNL